MKHPFLTIRALFTFILCSLVLISGASTASAAPYPATLSDFGEFERFPADVAGYHRGAVTAYAADLADYSIAYDLVGGELQNVVTLYFYPRLADTALQVQRAETAIFQAHPETLLVSRRSLNVPCNGQQYPATLATFEFEGKFAGKDQRLSSQLLMVFLPNKTFKIRSTTPLEQGARAEAAMLRLLEGLGWAS